MAYSLTGSLARLLRSSSDKEEKRVSLNQATQAELQQEMLQQTVNQLRSQFGVVTLDAVAAALGSQNAMQGQNGAAISQGGQGQAIGQAATAPQASLFTNNRLNLRGLDLRGVTFTGSGLASLQAMNGGQPVQLDLSGADISGAIFHPASSFDGVIIDEITPTHGSIEVGNNTRMQFLTFTGFSQQADLEFSGDMSYGRISGTDEKGAIQPSLRFTEGTIAEGFDITGAKLARLEVEPRADLSGLQAHHCSAITAHANAAILNGADFSGSHFGPESEITGSELMGANFSGATLSDMNFDKSNLVGADFTGVDLTKVSMRGSFLRAEDLQGANYRNDQGEQIDITQDNAVTFAQSRGVTVVPAERKLVSSLSPEGNISAEETVAQVKAQQQEILATREAGPERPITAPMELQNAQVTALSEVAVVDTPQTDELIQNLTSMAVAMMQSGLGRKIGYDEALSLGEQYHSAGYQREHDVPERVIN